MAEQTKTYDIVIIGSGAGGGTVAKELAPLAKQGVKIAVLEWGGWFKPEHNTRREIEMAGKYYFDSGGFQTSTQDMTFAFAKSVGGSTSVYTGVSFELPDDVVQKWNVPSLTSDDLKPRFQKYIQENNVHLQPPENINRNNTLFKEGCESLGWEVGQFPLNIDGCGGLNTCNIGCARGAKQGTAQVQLPVAIEAGVEVIPFCRVDRFDQGDVLVDVVPAEHGLAPAPWEPGRYRVQAKKIVLAAGAMNTTPILKRSFGSQLPDVLGRYFTCHPALTLIAEHEARVDGTIGHPKSYYCEDFVWSDRFLLETCMYFPFVASKNFAGFGPELDDLMSNFANLQMILVLVLDEARAENRIDIDADGNPVAHYNLADDLIEAFVKSVRASAKIFFAAGAKRAHLPGAKSFLTYANQLDQIDQLVTRDSFKLGQIAISAAHLMGGCRMGTDPATSIADPWGRVHGMPNLYIADGSLFPSSSEVNPYLTIMALADRVAQAIREDWQS